MKRFVILLAAVGAALAAAPAFAKEDVQAILDTRIPLNAAPGEQLDVAWTLSIIDQGNRRPFGAGGVFVQLFSASGGKATIGFAAGDGGQTGKFQATVTVPEGGIGALAIGLAGIVSGPTGTSRSDLYFPVKNSPFPEPAPAPSETGRCDTDSRDASSLHRRIELAEFRLDLASRDLSLASSNGPHGRPLAPSAAW